MSQDSYFNAAVFFFRDQGEKHIDSAASHLSFNAGGRKVTEQLLQFIWQMQYYNRGELCTCKGEAVEIIAPGRQNLNQGPDFLDARVKIGDTTWAGSVELHLATSGWNAHGHTNDRNFRNVILHVVWENDLEDHPLPLLELKDRVPKFLLRRYADLMNESSFIPCERMISETAPLTWNHWKDRLLAERLERKAEHISSLQQNNHSWQEVYWWLLARNFGHSVNSDTFESVARTLPISLIAKHSRQINQLEALLLGQAGLLDGNFSGSYPVMLQKEYRFLKGKYKIEKVAQPVHFLRMRPANFPTIRLAQLASLILKDGHHAQQILEQDEIPVLRALFNVSANDYWQTHYLPDKESPRKEKKLGDSMFDNILVNTIVPFLYAYGRHHRNEDLKQRGFRWLIETVSEENSITKGFRKIGMGSFNAADSQSLLELKTHYCNEKRCLACNVGNHLLYER